jgi:signal peptide peptidase SppA
MEEQKISKKEKIKMFFKKLSPSIKWIGIVTFGVIIGGSIVMFIFGSGYTTYTENNDGYYESCNVAGIELHGSLYTYLLEQTVDEYGNKIGSDSDAVSSENIIWSIEQANLNDNVKAILVEVDSAGGSPIAGEEVLNAIKNSKKPVVALIRERGLSASYLAISSADRIWASKYSDVGSIGVTMSYLNNTEKNRKDGYIYERLSVGKFKDTGSPDLPLTKEEKDLFMRDLNIMYENFVKDVSVNRNIPIEKVKNFADGSSVLGEQAKELGLIDEIGGIDEVKKYLEGQIGETIEVCW